MGAPLGSPLMVKILAIRSYAPDPAPSGPMAVPSSWQNLGEEVGDRR